MATADFPDFDGVRTALEKPNANGRAAATASRPVALSNEDKAALDAIKTAAELIDDLVLAEDAVHSSGAAGLMALSVRANTASALSGADGDYQPLITDTNGRLHTSAQLVAGTAIVGKVKFVDASDADVNPTPSVADDAADTGGSFKPGYRGIAGVTSIAPLSAANDRGDAVAGLDRVPFVRPHCGFEDIVTPLPVTCTSGAATSIVSAVASRQFMCTGYMVTGTAAEQYVTIYSGDPGSGGTARFDIPCGTGGAKEGGFEIPVPFATNTAVYADPSGSVTCRVTLFGFMRRV